MTEEQFTEAYLKYRKGTKGLLYTFCGDADLSEDFAQAAWVRGWEKRHQLWSDAKLQKWVNSIGVFMLLDYLRKHSRLVGGVDAEKTLSHLYTDHTEINYANRLDSQTFFSSIERVINKQIVSLWMQEYSFEEIGRIVGMSSERAKLRNFRAIRKMRGKIRDVGSR